ncbi:hypothetical protein ASD79_00905 [Caulobacter sp. Root655]|nr:hypothetical protein ASD79_00905 [Caulobacter sp. Root655]
MNGIRILNANTVNIENCYIYGDRAGAPNGNGVWLLNTAGTTRLNIANTTISETGVGTTGGAILIKPTGSGAATVSLDHVSLLDNTRGLVVEAAGTTGAVLMVVDNSTIANNTRSGVAIITGATAVNTTITNSSSTNNLTGLYVEGSGGVVRINNNTFTSNVTGLQSVSSGQIISYGTNILEGNTSNGAPTSTIALH